MRTPGAPVSTKNRPRSVGDGPVRATTTMKPAACAYGTNILVPLSTHPAPSRRALIAISAGSNESLRSVIATVPIMVPAASAPSHRSLISSEPPCTSALAASAEENKNGPGIAA